MARLRLARLRRRWRLEEHSYYRRKFQREQNILTRHREELHPITSLIPNHSTSRLATEYNRFATKQNSGRPPRRGMGTLHTPTLVHAPPRGDVFIYTIGRVKRINSSSRRIASDNFADTQPRSMQFCGDLPLFIYLANPHGVLTSLFIRHRLLRLLKRLWRLPYLGEYSLIIYNIRYPTIAEYLILGYV